MGTVIKPASDKEDYDVDLVCELSLSKSQLTQTELKAALGYELQALPRSHRMRDLDTGSEARNRIRLPTGSEAYSNCRMPRSCPVPSR